MALAIAYHKMMGRCFSIDTVPVETFQPVRDIPPQAMGTAERLFAGYAALTAPDPLGQTFAYLG